MASVAAEQAVAVPAQTDATGSTGIPPDSYNGALQSLSVTTTTVMALVFGAEPAAGIPLAPAFDADTFHYQATVPFGVTDLTLTAARTDPDSTVEASGVDAHGKPLGTQTTVGNASFGDEHGQARETGFLKRFTGMAVGDNEIVVNVTGAHKSDAQTFRVVVRRSGPNLEDESERQRFFHDSLRGGNVEGLSLALSHGADPNHRFQIGRGLEGTALTAAIMGGHEHLAIALVEAGADVNALMSQESGKIYDGSSALMEAAFRGQSRVVAILIEAGADVNHVLSGTETSLSHNLAGASSLIWAVAEGHADAVRILLEAGADMEHSLPGPERARRHATAGATAILLAAIKGMDDVVELLIEAGADVNRPLPHSVAGANDNLSGATPLMLAAFGGHLEVVRMLVAAGADKSYKVPRKLPSGAKVNRKTAGLTAMTLAKRTGHKEVVKFLRKR